MSKRLLAASVAAVVVLAWLRDRSHGTAGHGSAGLPEELRPVPRRRRRLPRLCADGDRRSERQPARPMTPPQPMRCGAAALGAAAGAILGSVTGHAGNGAAIGAGTGPLVRRRRQRQRVGLFVVSAAAAIRRRVPAMHVRAGQSGAGAGGLSRPAAGRTVHPNYIPPSTTPRYPATNYPPPNYPPPECRAGQAIRRRTRRRRISPAGG